MAITDKEITRRLNLIIETGGFGVSDEVDEASDRLISEIKRLMRLYDKEGKDEFSFKFQCFGTTIKVFVKTHTDEGDLDAYWLEPYKWLTIFVRDGEDGKVDNFVLSDAVQHELEHAYQNIKMGHGFGNGEVYAVAMGRLGSHDELERSLAEIVYYSTRNEQDAMINGLYKTIKVQRTEEPIDNIVRRSKAYDALKRLHKAREVLLSLKNDRRLLNYISFYKTNNGNYTYSYFLRIARRGIKELEWKLARLIKGTKQRFFAEFNVRPNISKRIIEGHDVPKNWLYFLI